MRTRKSIATAALAVWLSVIALAFGPVRWAFGHWFEHLIEGADGSLPALTADVSLPVLGIGPSTVSSGLVRLLFWGFVWLGPLALLIGVWRATSREALSDLLVYGGGLYATGLAMLVFLTLLGLWLPFGPIF